jgi:hypothetical protein
VEPTAGQAYLNISQTQNSGPYPASYEHTIRCDVPATTGTHDIPAELLAGLDAGVKANFVAAASVIEPQDVGDYELTFRLIALDAVRMIDFQ